MFLSDKHHDGEEKEGERRKPDEAGQESKRELTGDVRNEIGEKRLKSCKLRVREWKRRE